MLVTRPLTASIDLHYFSYYGNQWGPSTVLPTFFKNIFFCVQRGEKK